jgi:branched-chain amino acid transport system permease protein
MIPTGTRGWNRWLRLSGLVLLLGVAITFPIELSGPAMVNVGVFTLMYIGLSTAWNIVGGYTGYISLGHAGFFGFGAYALGLIVTRAHVPAGIDIFFFVPLASVATALFAVPVGWIALRTREATFVIVTIAVMFMLQILATNLRSVTGGSQGLAFPVPGWGASFDVPFYYAMLTLVIVSLAVSWGIRRSRFGLGLLAIRDDEDRARSLGIRTEVAKLAAFVISVALVGAIGAVYGYYVTYIYPQFVIDPLIGIAMVLMSFLGGMGTLAGPVIGALLLEPAQLYFPYGLGQSRLYLVVYAAVFLIVILLLPRGIVPTLGDRLEQWRSRRLAERQGHAQGDEVAVR